MIFDYQNPLIREKMYRGKFGLERETLRVDSEGRLAHTPHPFGDDESISRDFCENQVELITPPASGAKEVIEALTRLHEKVVRTLLSLETGAEYLWPFSNPPRISGEEDIPVADFGEQHKDKWTYRQYLAQKYGKKKMLFSGIHCNFSFDEELLERAFAQSGAPSFRDYKDGVYLTLAQRLMQYSWLIVYLTAASPVCDVSLLDDADDAERYGSIRCGEKGYWNPFVPILDYTGIESYTDSIWQYIQSGALRSASELYYPIRLKPRGANSLGNLRANGVNHIELRMFDVNPLTPAGIFEQDIRFVRLLILYLMSLDDTEFGETAQKIAVNNFRRAAYYGDYCTFVDVSGAPYSSGYYRKPIREAAADILSEMRVFYVSLSAPSEAFEALAWQENKLRDGRNRYAVRIREAFGGSFTEKGLALAKEYAAAVTEEV